MATKDFGSTGRSGKSTGSKVNTAPADDAEFRGYINVTLTDEQKAAYVKWAQSASFGDALEHQLGSGVNLSVKRSLKEACFVASGTQRSRESVNAGLCVTARGKEAGIALGRLLFILTILTKKDRWEDTQPVANPDRW